MIESRHNGSAPRLQARQEKASSECHPALRGTSQRHGQVEVLNRHFRRLLGFAANDGAFELEREDFAVLVENRWVARCKAALCREACHPNKMSALAGERSCPRELARVGWVAILPEPRDKNGESGL